MSADRPSWESARPAFRTDGSLRDILVLGTDAHDWTRFLSWLHSARYRHRFTRDGEEQPLPSVQALLSGNDGSQVLAVWSGNVLLNGCIWEESIELDLDPKDVDSAARYDTLLDFMSGLGERLRKDVLLTEESAPEEVWLRYSDTDRRIHLHNPWPRPGTGGWGSPAM